MKRSNNGALPRNALGFFFADAERHNLSLKKIQDVFDSWAYVQVQTPLVDYSKRYANLVTPSDAKKIYQLLDRDGSTLMLRWDITLFLVEHIARFANTLESPLRVSYADTILRHQDEHDIRQHEYFQVGAELLGLGGIDADAEIILLLIENLKTLELDASIHIGSRAVFDACFKGFSLEDRALISKAIVLRDRDAFMRATGQASDLWDFFSTILDFDELDKAEARFAKTLNAEALTLVKDLFTCIKTVKTLAPQATLRFDPSELGSQSYHSGVVFKAYLSNYDGPVASGGRYDALLAELGYQKPACGFSIMLSKILGKQGQKHESQAIVQVRGNFVDRFKEAEALRKTGQRVQL